MNELVEINVSVDYNPKVYLYLKNQKHHWKYKLPNGKWFYARAVGEDSKTVEKNTDIKIEDCFIVWFGPNENNYNIYKVKDYEYLIPGLIKDFIKHKEN